MVFLSLYVPTHLKSGSAAQLVPSPELTPSQQELDPNSFISQSWPSTGYLKANYKCKVADDKMQCQYRKWSLVDSNDDAAWFSDSDPSISLSQ